MIVLSLRPLIAYRGYMFYISTISTGVHVLGREVISTCLYHLHVERIDKFAAVKARRCSCVWRPLKNTLLTMKDLCICNRAVNRPSSLQSKVQK